jgi:hypothetical protein
MTSTSAIISSTSGSLSSEVKVCIYVGITLSVIAFVILGLSICGDGNAGLMAYKVYKEVQKSKLTKKTSMLQVHPSEVHGNSMLLEADGTPRVELE